MPRKPGAGKLDRSVKLTTEVAMKLNLVAARWNTTAGDLLMEMVADRVNAAYEAAVLTMADEIRAAKEGK
jgi:hypothetical protein